MTTNKWEQFAENFEEKNNYVVGLHDIHIVKEHLRTFTELGHVLELGCGNGTYTQCFLDSASNITATDLSEDMVAVTQNRFSTHTTVTVEQADCFNLRYSNSTFDTVFMANLLHVVPNPEAVLHECFRVLKEGGKVIAISFTLHEMSFLNRLLLKYRYLRTYGAKSSKSIPFTPELALDISRSAGFIENHAIVIGKNVKAVVLTALKPIQQEESNGTQNTSETRVL